MKYSVDNSHDHYTLIRLNEENLNSFIAPNLKSRFIVIKNEGAHNLILDLSDVKYADSSGLTAILTGNRLWKDDGTFILTGIAHPSVKKLLEISKLDTVLNIIPTLKESIEYVMLDAIDRELRGD